MLGRHRDTALGALLAAGLLSASGVAQVSAAQTVRGELVAEGTGVPFSGAFVTLHDASGAEVARARADAAGRFLLSAPEPGTYTLRAAVIGVRSWTSPAFEVGRGEMFYRAVMPVRAVRLDAVIVEGERECRIAAEAGAAVSQLWEEARKALAAVAWTRRHDSLWYQVIRYERLLDPDEMRVLQGTMTRQSGFAAASPFQSTPVEILAMRGYVRDSGGAWIHSGPDAEVLLSDEFANAHCFLLAEHGDDPGLIGLAFRPQPGRTVPEIRGTLWLDRASAHLRSLDFEYVGAPWPVRSNRLGGHVEFEQLAGGGWIVSHWWLRIPEIVTRLRGTPGRQQREPVLAAVRETGGHVVQMREPTPLSARTTPPARPASPPVLRGTVHAAGSGAPIGSAAILLRTADGLLETLALTDTAGAFRLEAPGPGRYQVAILRSGFARGRSDLITLSDGDEIEVLVTLAPDRRPPAPGSAPSADARAAQSRAPFSFSGSALSAVGPRPVMEVLSRLPGASVETQGDGAELRFGGLACRADLFIDGIPAGRHEPLFTLPSSAVALVEVYPPNAPPPPDFRPAPGRPRCGTILLWTIAGS